jgi:hypothetical protein
MKRPLTGTILCEAEDYTLFSMNPVHELVLILDFVLCMMFGLEGSDVSALYESVTPFHLVDIYETRLA